MFKEYEFNILIYVVENHFKLLRIEKLKKIIFWVVVERMFNFDSNFSN